MIANLSINERWYVGSILSEEGSAYRLQVVCKIIFPVWWGLSEIVGWAASYHTTAQKVLGRRVRTGPIATHIMPTCTQTKAPLLKLWSHAHGKWSCYKRVMASKYNITTIKKIRLLLDRISKEFSIKIKKRITQQQETHYKWNGKGKREIILVFNQ